MTIRRIIDGLLVVGIVVGAVWAWRLGAERNQLQATYTRLTSKVGDLAGGDPSKILVQSLPTGQPMRFAWRVHLPPGPFPLKIGSRRFSTTIVPTPGQEAIIRVAFREDDGRFMACVDEAGAMSDSDLGGPEVADLLRGRWDELSIDQAGRGETLVADPAKPFVLFRLTLPPPLAEAAKPLLMKHDQRSLPVLFEVTKP